MRAAARAFFARHPLFASAVVMAGAVVAIERGGGLWPWAFVPLVLGPLLAGWRLGAICGLAGLAAAWVVDARHTARDDAAAHLGEVRAGGTLVLKLLTDARQGPSAWTATARVLAAEDPAAADVVGGKVRIFGRGGEVPVAGTRMRVRGDFLPPREARNPGEFDEVSWLRREGLAGVFGIARGGVEAHTSGFAAWRAGVRRAFRESITAGLDEDSQSALVIRAVVIGEQPRDEVELIDAFRHSGTMHVFCVSGLHVGMVGMLGWLVLGLVGVPRRAAVLLILPLMFGYTWLTGSGAPAVRASCMGAVFLGAFVLQRRPDALNALGAVLSLMLLWDGRMLFQPGVQLSYGVVLAIILGAAVAGRLFSWLGRGDAHQPLDEASRPHRAAFWLRRRTAQSLAVSTAAWAGSTPLTAFHFGLFTPASIPATVVQIPIIFCLLGMALISAIIHPVAPWASRGINQANAGLAHACVGVARAFAALPGGHVRLGGDGARLIVYDLQYGANAAVFAAGEGGAVMVDCGSAKSFRRRVLGSLRRLGIRPDAVIFTHPDGGHLGGGSAVWQSLPVRQALLPVVTARSPAYREWLDGAPHAGVATGIGVAGQRHPLGGGAWIEVVHDPSDVSHRARADERVMILRLHWEGWKILFTSDAGLLTERRMIKQGLVPSADVIIAGKHRNDLHLGDEFITAVNPRAIIASNAAFPAEQQLNQSQVAYWRSIGIEVVDQMQAGAAILSVDAAGALWIRGFVDGGEIRLAPEP